MKIPITEYDALRLAEALHKAADTVIEQVGTGFAIAQLQQSPLQPGEERLGKEVDTVALAQAVTHITATADVFGVNSDDLVRVLKYPDEGVRRYKLLARLAQFLTRMPSLLYPEEANVDGEHSEADEDASDNDGASETNKGVEIFESTDDDETDDELERLETAVKEDIESACLARDETEIAMDDLEQSFRALIKAKDARGDV